MEKKKKFVFGTTAFIVFGVLCFLLGFGLLDGWEAVRLWFAEGNAWVLFAALMIYALAVILYLWKKGEADGRE